MRLESFAGIEARAALRGKRRMSGNAVSSQDGRHAAAFRGSLVGFPKKSLHRSAWSPIIPLSTGWWQFPKTLTRRTLNPSQAATDRPAERQSGTADFLRPVRPGTRAGSPVGGTEAETYGAAESVRTPTADRCCHEGRQEPSMARWAKPARVEIGVVPNGRCSRAVTGRTVKIKAGLARHL